MPDRSLPPRLTSASPRVLVLTPIYPWPGDPHEGMFVHRQIVNLVRSGIACRVLTYRPAVRGLPSAFTPMSWLRYHPRWAAWPRALDAVPVSHTFYPRRLIRDDVVPDIGDALIRYIERHPEYRDTDVVYAHWLWTGGAAALRLREHFGWPVAAIARGSDMHHWHGIHRHCRPHVERVLSEADLVLANCEGLRQRADEIAPGSAASMHVVYNGCDARQFRPVDERAALRRALGLPVDESLLLCCASLIERKGIEELVRAWRLFSRGHPNWRLVLIGRRVERDLVRQVKRAGPGPVTLVGQVPSGEVASYMQAADAYVQPSRLEGLANATLEAMATALPVISTDTGGQREAVEDGANGWLVPPRDAEAIAGAMRELARNPEEAWRRGIAARQTVIDRFGPTDHVARLSDLLRRLVHQPAHVPQVHARHLVHATPA